MSTTYVLYGAVEGADKNSPDTTHLLQEFLQPRWPAAAGQNSLLPTTPPGMGANRGRAAVATISFLLDCVAGGL